MVEKDNSNLTKEPQVSTLSNAGSLDRKALAFLGAKLPLAKGKLKGVSSLPPTLDNTIKCMHVFRYFVATASVPVSVSVNDMLGALGGVCTVTNSAFKPWASSFRLKAVVAFPSGSSSSTDNFAQLSWNSGLLPQQRDQLKTQDIPQGISVTKPVVFKPPKLTLAGDWVACTASVTANLFTIFADAGSIIDLHVDFTLSNTFIPGTISIGTGVLNSVYYLPLDGPGSNTIVQAHLPTTH
jgi:hypothetical protein